MKYASAGEICGYQAISGCLSDILSVKYVGAQFVLNKYAWVAYVYSGCINLSNYIVMLMNTISSIKC